MLSVHQEVVLLLMREKSWSVGKGVAIEEALFSTICEEQAKDPLLKLSKMLIQRQKLRQHLFELVDPSLQETNLSINMPTCLILYKRSRSCFSQPIIMPWLRHS